MASGVAAQPYWSGHRPAAALLIICELLVRVAFFGFQTIIVLFLSQPVSEGGFGWSDGRAILVSGVVSGLYFVAPLIGAWIGIKFYCPRRCIGLGFLFTAIGCALLGVSHAAVPFMSSLTDLPLRSIFAQSGVMLGDFDWGLTHALLADELAGSDLSIAIATQIVIALSFASGLLILIAGGALATVHVSTCFGQIYKAHDRRPEKGFTYLYLSINISLIMGTIVVGGVGERFGWTWSFVIAAVSALACWLLYVWKQDAYLGDIGRATNEKAMAGTAPSEKLSVQDWAGIKALAVVGLVAIIFYIPDGQSVLSVSLFIEADVRRMLGGFEIPVTWFQSLNPIFTMLLGALLAVWVERFMGRGRSLSVVLFFAAAYLVMIGGYGLLVRAVDETAVSSDGLSHPGWVMSALFLVALGELLLMPMVQSLISRIGPPRYASLAMAGYFIVYGLGIMLSGIVGAPLAALGYATQFWVMIAIAVAGLLVLIIATPALRRWIAVAETRDPHNGEAGVAGGA